MIDRCRGACVGREGPFIAEGKEFRLTGSGKVAQLLLLYGASRTRVFHGGSPPDIGFRFSELDLPRGFRTLEMIEFQAALLCCR